jgi:hypothetical protein
LKQPVGTGFFISHSYPERSDGQYVFLVTAKHVLYDQEGKRFPKMFLRMNHAKTNLSHDFDLLQNNRWFFHPTDETVDLAVQPLLPREAKFKWIPSSMWVTNQLIKEKRISIGDEVFYTGLLPRHSGVKRIMPITRFGRLALVPDEKTFDGRNLHFIDADNIPGHSGSPVFLWATPARSANQLIAGPRIFALYGVVSSVVEYTTAIKFAKQSAKTKTVPVDFRSGGVTGVTPVEYLWTIINGADLRAAIGLGQSKDRNK